jgi:hypothetical protein
MTRQQANNKLKDNMHWVTIGGLVLHLAVVLSVVYAQWVLLNYRVEQMEKTLNNGVRSDVREVRQYCEKISEKLHEHLEDRDLHRIEARRAGQ